MSRIVILILIYYLHKPIKKLHGLSSRANYTDRATAACRRSDCQLLQIEGATWSAWRIATAVFSVIYQVAPQLYSWGTPINSINLFGSWWRRNVFPVRYGQTYRTYLRWICPSETFDKAPLSSTKISSVMWQHNNFSWLSSELLSCWRACNNSLPVLVFRHFPERCLFRRASWNEHFRVFQFLRFCGRFQSPRNCAFNTRTRIFTQVLRIRCHVKLPSIKLHKKRNRLLQCRYCCFLSAEIFFLISQFICNL
jgi:hypothetical protein